MCPPSLAAYSVTIADHVQLPSKTRAAIQSSGPPVEPLREDSCFFENTKLALTEWSKFAGFIKSAAGTGQLLELLPPEHQQRLMFILTGYAFKSSLCRVRADFYF